MADRVLRELNVARQQPHVYIEHLKARRTMMDSRGLIQRPGQPSLQTKEGYVAIDEAINYLEGQVGQQFPELTLSHGMSRACQDLIDANGPAGVLGHTGSDGSTLMDRLARYGQIQHTAGENIDYGNTDPVIIILQLITDDGGHRTNIYNPQFRVVGIALGPHKVYGHSCCMDFAGGYIESTPAPENVTRTIQSYPPPSIQHDESGPPPPLPPKPGVKKALPSISNPDQIPALQSSPRKSQLIISHPDQLPKPQSSTKKPQPFLANPPQLPPLQPGARKSVMAMNPPPIQHLQPAVKKSMAVGTNPTPLQNLPPGAKKAVTLTPGQGQNIPLGRRQSAPPPVVPGKITAGPVITEFSLESDPSATSNEPLIEMNQSLMNQVIFKPKVGKSEVKIVVTMFGNNSIKFDMEFAVGAVTCQSSQTYQLPSIINTSNIKMDGSKIVVTTQ